MIPILIILCVVIALTDMIKLSLMGWKTTLLWSIVWMSVAYCSTMWLIKLSSDEIYGSLNIRSICLLGFMESFIFISYLFYDGKWKCILAYYPGLMMIFPVTILAFWISRIINGVSFMATGAIASSATMALLTGMTLFLRWLRCEKSWLYIVSIVSFIIYILTFGIS